MLIPPSQLNRVVVLEHGQDINLVYSALVFAVETQENPEAYQDIIERLFLDVDQD